MDLLNQVSHLNAEWRIGMEINKHMHMDFDATLVKQPEGSLKAFNLTLLNNKYMMLFLALFTGPVSAHMYNMGEINGWVLVSRLLFALLFLSRFHYLRTK